MHRVFTRNEAKDVHELTHSHEPVSNRGKFVIQDNSTPNTQLILKDHSRRRLQAVVQTQQSEPKRTSEETRNVSNTTSNNPSSNPTQRLKIINKKLITFSNNKTDRFNSTQITANSNNSTALQPNMTQLNLEKIIQSQPTTDQHSGPTSARQMKIDLTYSSTTSAIRKPKTNSNQLGYRR